MRRVMLIAAATVGLLAAVASTPAMAAPSPDPGGDTSGAPGEAGAGQDLASFGIAPAGVDRPDQRPFLSITAPAGAVVYEHAALINQAGTPVELQVYSGDVVMADGGTGLSVTPRAQEGTGAGSWVTLDSPSTVTVPAQTVQDGYGYVVVPFTVTIPANAEPGDHVGAIVASLVATGSGGDNSPNIELEQRVAARVYIRVDGEIEPGLEITDVVAGYSRDAIDGRGAVEVAYTLRNTGNERMAVQPRVQVAGPFGLLARSVDGDRVDELLPGGETSLTAVVDDVWPLVLADVTVSAEVVAAAGGQDPGIGTLTAWTRVWTVPWLVFLALLFLATWWSLRLRRTWSTSGRRGRKGKDAAGSADLDTPRTAPEPVSAGAGAGAGVGVGSTDD